MKRYTVCALVAALTLVSAAATQEPIDQAMVARIREEGLQRSRVLQTFNQLVTVFGPRLTASPAFNAAARWARDRLGEWGLANAHLESWEFGRGWTLEKLSIEMIEPRYMPLIGYATAWSPSTQGRIVAEPVMLGEVATEELAGDPQAALARHQGKLRGAIVMTELIETRFIRQDRPSPKDQLQEERRAAAGPDRAAAQATAEQDRLRQQRRQEFAR
ncbi:MAG: hypothetical protein ACE5HV_05915, partial [Acidobacteriota bacterium]